MQEVAGMILEGANAFLSRQYRTIAILAAVTAVVVGVIVGIFKESAEIGVLDGRRLPRRRCCLRLSGLHRHVHRRALERPHRGGGPEQPQGRDHGRRCAVAPSPASSSWR